MLSYYWQNKAFISSAAIAEYCVFDKRYTSNMLVIFAGCTKSCFNRHIFARLWQTKFEFIGEVQQLQTAFHSNRSFYRNKYIEGGFKNERDDFLHKALTYSLTVFLNQIKDNFS